MNESLRYDKGLGNSEVYCRVTNGNLFFNFSTIAWVGTEVAGCRVFLTEYPDTSTVQSWYAGVIPPVPVGGPYGVDVVRLSTGAVIGNDFITQSVDVVLPIDSSAIKASELFDVVLQRLAAIKKPIQIDFFNALNATVDIIFRRLLVRKSEIIEGSFSQAVIAPTATVTLPGDFFGFAERPYLSGTTSLLDPIPAEMKSGLSASSTPLYYELRGRTMTLYPVPVSNITVIGQYYQKPVKITSLSASVPFNSLFDFAIQEAVIDICQMGMAAITDKNFTALLYKQIDEILPFRAPRQISFMATQVHSQRFYRGSSPYYFN